VVYYSGHGVQFDGRNFLLPAGARMTRVSDVEFEAVPLDLVMAAVAEARKAGVAVLDASRANPFLNQLVQDGRVKHAVADGLGTVAPAHGEIVVSAAGPGKVAAAGDGAHSPFTQSMLQSLGEGGEGVGGWLTKLGEAAKKDAANGQEPVVYGAPPAGDPR
jgi:uncharacterized caspase-like protein